VGHEVIRKQRRPVVEPVVLSKTWPLTRGPDKVFVLLNDNYREDHPVLLPDDSPELIFPASWNRKDLEARVELEIPPGKRTTTVAFHEFDHVQQLMNGAWPTVRQMVVTQGRAPSFHVKVQPGKHSFRGLFRTVTRSGFAANPSLSVFDDGQQARSVTYRITVKPVE
jgi:hypothetical protein